MKTQFFLIITLFILSFLDPSSVSGNNFSWDDETDKAKQSVLSIYPNPVKKQATLKINIQEGANVQIELFDITGKRVQKIPMKYLTTGEQLLKIDCIALKNGVYMCKLTHGKQMISKRFVIRH